ncbi:hypothetical protein A2U01_0002952, partial [Trifolium medium]|nr:hypothetical protein [Trifolium medium]
PQASTPLLALPAQQTTCTFNTMVLFDCSASSACTHGCGPMVAALHSLWRGLPSFAAFPIFSTALPRDVNRAGIERRVLYHSLSHHLKYSPSPSPFPASGSILPSSTSLRIPTVSAEIYQP